VEAAGSALLRLAEDSSQKGKDSQSQVLKHFHDAEACPHEGRRHQHRDGGDYDGAEDGNADPQEEGGQPGDKGNLPQGFG